MRILCIVDQYYPYSSANTVCCDNIIKYLKELKDIDSVDVLSVKQNYKETNFEFNKENNMNVFKIDTFYTKWCKTFNVDKWDKIPFVIRKGIGLFYRLIYFYKKRSGHFLLDVLNYRKISKTILKYNRHEKYDYIISFSSPFALQRLAVELKERNIGQKVVSVLLDPFVFNATLNLKLDYKKKYATQVLSKADLVCLTNNIKEYNILHNYNPEYHNKSIDIQIPMLDVIHKDIYFSKGKDVKLIFGGMFYDDIRNPTKVLDILNKLPDNLKTDIYSKGSESIIKSFMESTSNNSINFHDVIKHDKMIELLKNECDILVNIGNSIDNQIPSKVFEYISIRKPIINFYYLENDTSKIILSKYPYVYNLNLNNYTNKSIEELIAFCNDVKGKSVSVEDLEKEYNSYFAKNITNKIYSNMRK